MQLNSPPATFSVRALYSNSAYFFRKKKREAEIILSYRIRKISCHLGERKKKMREGRRSRVPARLKFPWLDLRSGCIANSWCPLLCNFHATRWLAWICRIGFGQGEEAFTSTVQALHSTLFDWSDTCFSHKLYFDVLVLLYREPRDFCCLG